MSDSFIEVSKERFFETVGRLDVIPRPQPDVTLWELRNRTLVGRTTPGYRCEGKKAYFVAAGYE